MSSPDVPGSPRPRLRANALRGISQRSRWIALLVLATLLPISYVWYVQRVEVGAEEVLILIRKVGRPLPATAGGMDIGQQVVLYPALLNALGEPPNSTRYKGIVFEPLGPGRYFYDPFLWERIKVPVVQIPDGQVGVRVRRFGRPLPDGRTVATQPDERGPEAELLQPGRYNVNPFAYEVRRVPPVVIPAGFVGVQTLLAGPESDNPNVYVVETGKRGVQADVLPPGMTYNNPYVRRIDLIDVRSHILDLHSEEAIRFPSNDSFEIVVDCTVEYAIRQDMAPYVMVAIGTHDDIRDKLILPQARSLCRIEGSKLQARDFIAGETRTVFQRHVFEQLRDHCYDQGIEIRATLIRRIVPPAEIAGPISDRQIAGQQIKQYENEIRVAEAEARLVEQQELQQQNQAIGQANREIVALVKDAEQQKAVALTAAQQRLEVARLKLQAAAEMAAATLSRGKAAAEVQLLQYRAEAEPLQAAVQAFGNGHTYAQFFFYQKLAPAVRSVLASTDGPFGDIFRALVPTGPPPEGRGPETPRTAGGGQ